MSTTWHTVNYREQVTFTDDFKNDDGSTMSNYQILTQLIPNVLSCIEEDYDFVDWSTLQLTVITDDDGIIKAYIAVNVDQQMESSNTDDSYDHGF